LLSFTTTLLVSVAGDHDASQRVLVADIENDFGFDGGDVANVTVASTVNQ
jgi:hypothetical protein